MDVLAVRECVAEHLRLAREERQPTLVEALTYRFRGHSAADPEVYRTKEEVQQWRERDPIVLYAQASEGGRADRRRRASRSATGSAIEIVDEAVEFADAEPRARARVALRQRLRARRPGAGLVLGRRAHARGAPRRGRARGRQRTASRTSWPRRAPPTRAPATCRSAARDDEAADAAETAVRPTRPRRTTD